MESASSRVDERALGAGTTARFALLVALLVASSSLMVLYVAIALSTYDGFGCSLAAGVAPDSDPAAAVIAKRALQWEAYFDCTKRYAAPPPWWVLAGWWAILALFTAGLFWVLPAWKARRGRVVPLAAMDPDGEIAATVAELATVAGLARPPRVVVDPAMVASTGAVVFGRSGRATVRLDGGLVARRVTDPRRFRAILLHELAHIANRDVTITYLTVAMWRVYAVVALPPFLAWCAWMFRGASDSVVWSSEAPIVARGLLITGLLTVLVYLARLDVLRSREIYADLAAVRWGADPAGWSAASPPPVTGRGRRALRWFVELWRLHPRWDTRRTALTDPAVLFGVRALPLVLTGMTAAITHTHVMYALTQYILLAVWAQHVAALLSAGLVAGVVGIALWRAVVYAALTGQPAPSSARAGLWLGLGMAAGGVAAGQGTVNDWLPARPWLLVLVVLAGMAFTWWLTRCARLWVGAWRGRSLRPVALLNVFTAALALSLWLLWWHTQGVAFAAGWSIDIADVRNYLASPVVGRESAPPSVSWLDVLVVAIMTVAGVVANAPLALLAVAGLWVVPLLAWLSRPGVGPPRWLRDAASGGGHAPLGPPLPSLRRVLVPVLIGGACGGATAVAVLAWLHARKQVESSPTTFLVATTAGMILVLLVSAALAAYAGRAAVPAHRLPAALIGAGGATLLSFAAVVALRAADGCVPALAIGAESCSWNLAVAKQLFTSALVPAAPFTVLVAGVVALPGARATRRPGSTRATGPARPGSPASAVLGRACALALVAAVLALATVAAVQRSPQASRIPAPADVQRVARNGGAVVDEDAPVSALSRALQVEAWRDRGGGRLMDRFYHHRRDLFAMVTAEVNAGKYITDLDSVRPLCVDIADDARAAYRFFRVPDPKAEELWESFYENAVLGGTDCQRSLDADDADSFNAAMRRLATAQDTSHAIDDRIDALIRAGGL
ncbi:M48 family metallopeptidase [Micromonospora eburnea]|uniref:Peptidase family M48 n=1 Tax=Micromonospora eburnea TaxID=227316 RepID=A0A1C6UAK5_9ACTN|nr:M48 family metalloprotease [Micromonospora eburnea]SCL51046.1 Peptidase family M48 [Micromonospora eburnea]